MEESQPPEGGKLMERWAKQKRRRDSPTIWQSHDEGSLLDVAGGEQNRFPPDDSGWERYPAPLTHKHFELVLKVRGVGSWCPVLLQNI